MKLISVILLVSFAIGQLGRPVHLNDLLVGVLGGIGLVRMRQNPLFKPIFVWIFVMLLSIIINHVNLDEAFYAFRWIAYAGLYFLAAKTNLKLITLLIAVIGLVQYLLIPNTSFLSAYHWDQHYFRLISTFLDPGFTGAILVLGLFLTYKNIFSSAIIFTAILLTYSRASYLMYLTGFAVIAFYKKSPKIFLVSAIILLVAIPFLPQSVGEGTKLGRESSIEARVRSWQQAITVWQTSPIMGIGFNAYRSVTNQPEESHAGAGSDASVLNVLATTGIIGLISYSYLLIMMWQRGKILFKASLAAVFVHSWFNNTLFYPFVMEWLWLLLILDS